MNVKTVLELTTEYGLFIDILIFNGQIVLRCEDKENESIIQVDLTDNESIEICKALIHARKSAEFNYEPFKTVIGDERNILL